MRISFELHVVAIGLMALVVSVCAIIFALGFTVMVIQLGARILCKRIFAKEIGNVNAEQVCIS